MTKKKELEALIERKDLWDNLKLLEKMLHSNDDNAEIVQMIAYVLSVGAGLIIAILVSIVLEFRIIDNEIFNFISVWTLAAIAIEVIVNAIEATRKNMLRLRIAFLKRRIKRSRYHRADMYIRHRA